MTHLAQISLEFCRECLGWSHVRTSEAFPGMLVNDEEAVPTFTYTDLNAVMEAVRGWCDKHDRILETSYYRGSYMARVFTAATRRDEVWEQDEQDCAALLAACVEASRKMKGIAS